MRCPHGQQNSGNRGGSIMFFHSEWLPFSCLASAFTTLAFSLFIIISLKGFPFSCNKISKQTASFTGARPEMRRNKRQCQRLKINDIVVHVSDGRGYCEGFLNDISRIGLCLKFSSGVLERKPEELGVLLKGHGKFFLIKVKPKWEQYDGLETCIGSQIVDAHWRWERFRENIGSIE